MIEITEKMTKTANPLQPIYIGAAWPYANGNPHLGHIAGLLAGDVLARYFRQKGHPVLYVSGSDCHGTPISVEADKEGISPAALSERYHQVFRDALINGLGFSYDLYTTTTTELHKKTVQEFFRALLSKDFLQLKSSQQFFCESCKRFLPDRFVEGTCPKCGFGQGRGDQCDECGVLLDPEDILHPKCKICGHVPIFRKTEHFYFRLSLFEKKLKEWVRASKGWTANALNFTKGLLEQKLKDRPITRDIDWGVPIPLEGFEEKRLYVWFDAVVGYVSASKEWASANNHVDSWEQFWKQDDVIAYYVHGKDNVPFHTIIWPAMLMGVSDLHLPDRIIASEYLTLEGRQFSKSRQWAVWVPDFLQKFDPDALRYYLIANGPETMDADFSWKQFQSRINGDIIGNFGNFIHRTCSFIADHFPDGVTAPEKVDSKTKELRHHADQAFEKIGKEIEQGHFRSALQEVIEIASEGNRFLNDKEPWHTVKKDREKTEHDLAVLASVIRDLGSLIRPFLPFTSDRIFELIGCDRFQSQSWRPAEPTKMIIKNPRPLFRKIEDADIEEEDKKLHQAS